MNRGRLVLMTVATLVVSVRTAGADDGWRPIVVPVSHEQRYSSPVDDAELSGPASHPEHGPAPSYAAPSQDATTTLSPVPGPAASPYSPAPVPGPAASPYSPAPGPAMSPYSAPLPAQRPADIAPSLLPSAPTVMPGPHASQPIPSPTISQFDACSPATAVPTTPLPTVSSTAYASPASPVTTFRPIVTLSPVPATQVVGRGIVGQPTVYVPGQPVRNFLRWLSP